MRPLVGDPQLTVAAQRYAVVVAASASFGHACGPVPRLGDRVTAVGGARRSLLGENVAAGQATPERVVAARMASPTHRANLFNPEFTLLGVGRAVGGAYGTYWAQELQELGARRAGPGAPSGAEPAYPPRLTPHPRPCRWDVPEASPSDDGSVPGVVAR